MTRRYFDWSAEAVKAHLAAGKRLRLCTKSGCGVYLVVLLDPKTRVGWPLEADGGVHHDNCVDPGVPAGYDPFVSHRITKQPIYELTASTRQRKLEAF